MSVRSWPCGGIIHADPLIAVARRNVIPNPLPGPNDKLGLLTSSPETFDGKASLTFLTVAWTHEKPHMIGGLVRDLDCLTARNPDAVVCMCANTDREYELYQEADIRTIMGPKNIFTRLDRFFVPEQRSPKAFDAVYVARLVEMKRHHLAAQIDRLICIYDNTSLENLHTFKEMLPRALFANHASENGSYVRVKNASYRQTLDRAAVGLCLSEREGVMRASVEYQLCGLPVVSTPNTGGRDRYLKHRFARHADPEPGAIAQAVEMLRARKFDPHEVRANVVALIERDRAQFLADAQRVADEVFGARAPQFGSFECFDRVDLQRHRHIDQVMEPTLAT